MTTQPPTTRLRDAWSRPMAARDSQEPHRTATPLELFFDLCFVVAVAAVSDRLHHALVEHHIASGAIAYALVFFGIWWAWMNFTWFASAYDTDDIAYRLTTFVQIAGVLVLAAGVPRAFDTKDFSIIFAGYVLMRVGLVTQWLRAARGDPAGRRTAIRFAIGVSACMVGWALVLVVPDTWRLPVFLVLVVAELSVPVWAERARNTPWHPHHISERYGLFTLIVLGETVLTSTAAIQRGLDTIGSGTLLGVALCGLVIVFSMWWIYFGQHAERFLRSNREGFRWGYGHYLIFSSAAAVGAGMAVVVDRTSHIGHVSATLAGTAITLPVAIYILSVWLVHVRPQRPLRLLDVAYPATAALVVAALATPWVLPLTAVFAAALVLTTVLIESG
jgi:low temperature requirement protein LtrA